MPTESMSWLVCGAVWIMSSHLPWLRLGRTMKGITRSGGQCSLTGHVNTEKLDETVRRVRAVDQSELNSVLY